MNQMFYTDNDTHEYCFDGNKVVAYWDTDEKSAVFFLKNHLGYTTDYSMFKDQFEQLCIDIEEHSDRYFIEKNDCGGFLFRKSNNIPVDRDDLHFTGFEYFEVTGDWVLEDDTEERDELVGF